MAAGPKTAVPVVLGAMTFGKEGVEQTRVHDLKTCSAILTAFQSHGHIAVDTSRIYGLGSSESYLGELNWKARGLVMQTKVYPTIIMPMDIPGVAKFSHSAADLKRGLLESLSALKADKGDIDLWYLHAPDRTTPFLETCRAVNELYQEGYFKRWGISNYTSWEVAQICEVCLANNFILPSVYQGLYHALHRTVEHELLPCLRKYGLGFYAFNPLAGGFLTGSYTRDTQEVETNSRFDNKRLQGRQYRERYWNEENFDALDVVKPVVEQAGLRMAEVALRWMMHHSQLARENGDAVIIGASSVAHIEQNMKDLEGGELPGDIVEALEEGWKRTRGVSWKYFH